MPKKSKWRKIIDRTIKLTLIELLELTVSFMAVGAIITFVNPQIALVVIGIFVIILLFRIMQLFEKEEKGITTLQQIALMLILIFSGYGMLSFANDVIKKYKKWIERRWKEKHESETDA